MLTVAHFQVIQEASAFTSSSVTLGWYRIPPLAGPRARLCCTRYPSNTLIEPSSILVGMETTSWRFGLRRTSRSHASSFRLSAAVSNCFWAISNGLRVSLTRTLSMGPCLRNVTGPDSTPRLQAPHLNGRERLRFYHKNGRNSIRAAAYAFHGRIGWSPI